MDIRNRLDLVRRVQLALSITQDAVAQAVDDARAGAGGAAPNARPLVLTKVVAELSMLLGCASGAAPELARPIEEVARELLPFARGRELRARLCREPALALDHAAAHIHLKALGYPDEETDRLLALIVEEHTAGGSERLPFRDVEFEWLGHLWQGSSAPPSPDLLARTCVARPLDVLGSTTTDLYFFTHVILHATDMGRRAVGWPRSATAIAADAEAGIAAALDADNFDLTAELLWVWPMLGLEWSATAAFAFELLTAAQDEYEFLPGPEWSPETASQLAAGDQRAYSLRTSYHANLVMGLLCAAILRQSAASSERVPRVGGRDQFAEVMRAVTIPGRLPRWHRAIFNLDQTRQGALVGMVLTIVMQRASRQPDFDRLREGLALWLRLDLPAGPAIDQCVGLLRRATLAAMADP